MTFELDQTASNNLLDYFARREVDVLALTRSLVERESPSGDLEGSRAVVELLEREARGITSVSSATRVPVGDYGEHLLVEAFGSGGGGDERTTLLLGHTDTVHPRGSLAERPLREEGGRVYGPGIFDMKSGCAVALEALRACAELKIAPRRPVVLLLTCDEEAGSRSGRALVEREARRAAQVLVLEPPAPGGRAKTARKGTGIFTLRAEGRAAHAGLDFEKGASAVLELARQTLRLNELCDAARGVTVNVGVFAGGTRSNVVAEEATAEIDVRFETMADALRVEESIKSLRPLDERVRLSIEGGINRPPLERTASVAKLYAHARAVASALGFDLGETSVGGASDGNFAAALCPAVLDGLGVEGDGAHASHEHIVRESLARRGALVAGLIATL
ncbi:MAG: M20 family metallopeptidase [Acidobacteria bacterium]|nr:M20 family metallopeptidase [Acidobacteriota bacterium]MCA1642535.1 M20 family metallopeptidase [Acidobacteriota bacterium]